LIRRPGTAEDVDIVGALAFVADGASGLRIIDVSNPRSPAEVGALGTLGHASDVDVTGDLAYVASLRIGVIVVDVSDPAAPMLRAVLGSQVLGLLGAQGVEVEGDLAYVAAGFNVHIVDSDSSAPLPRGFFQTPGVVEEMQVVEDFVYVADGFSGVRVIDVSNRAAPPVERGAFQTPGTALGVDVTNGLAYVADGDSGLRIIDFGPEYVQKTSVDVDIKPGGDRSAIPLADRSVIPVAILGSESFDVGNVDATALRFGPAGAGLAHLRGPHFADVNGDGVTDLLAHFRVGEAGIAPGDREACLTGATLEGQAFEGCDSIRTLP